jgi:hypothetical protein
MFEYEKCGGCNSENSCECVPCPNFEVCDGRMTDPRLLACRNCTFRDLVNKKKRLLKFEDGHDCPVCLEDNITHITNNNVYF